MTVQQLSVVATIMCQNVGGGHDYIVYSAMMVIVSACNTLE